MVRRSFLFVSLCAAVVCAQAGVATAAVVVEYGLTGAPGNQAFTAPSFVDPNATGLNVTRSAGLNPSAAGNSISASGWDIGDYFSFGFDVSPGFFANLDSLEIGTRSSNSGPGTLELFYSGDGFTTSLGQTVQVGTLFSNTVIDLSGLTGLTGPVEFRLTMLDTTSANGGTVASGGTMRIANYFDGVDTGGFRINGTISAVPEPTSFVALAVGAVAFTASRRRLRKAAAK